MPKTGIGVTVIRKEANDKVTGCARYTDDFHSVGALTARVVTSTCAHGKFIKFDSDAAAALPGVRAILTGEDCPLAGSLLEDRPLLAREKVRYYGEPVAIVVADNEKTAAQAAFLVQVAYEPLPVVKSPSEALQSGTALVHENLGSYKKMVTDIYPESGTNICDRKQIRKGDVQQALTESAVVVEGHFTLPQSDHIAMETRAVQAKIDADGTVFIRTSSQSPHGVKKRVCTVFNLDEGKVVVEVPFVGGGFGGKAPIQLELLAYMASRAVGGREVNCGCVEYGPAMKTTLAQILSEKLKMDIDRIFVNMDVNTKYSPKHWKTVASMTTYLAGNAVLRAAEDIIRQLKSLAAVVLRCPPENLEVADEMVYVKSDPTLYLKFKDLVHGYKYQNGNAVEGQIPWGGAVSL